MLKIYVRIFCLCLTALLIGCGGSATSPEQVLPQLRGGSCSYNSDCSRTGWSDRVRHPEYHCRMHAAACLAKMSDRAKDFRAELVAARAEMPERFNTGDGVIEYAQCIDSAIAAIDSEISSRVTADFLDCGY